MIKRPPNKGTVSNGPAQNAGPFLFPTKATPAKFWPVTHCRLPAQAAHVRQSFCGLLIPWPAGLPSGTVAAVCRAAGTLFLAVAGLRSKPFASLPCRRCRFAAAWPVAGRPCRLAASRGRAPARGNVCRPLGRSAWPVIMPAGRRCRRLPPIRPPPPPPGFYDRFTTENGGLRLPLTLVNLS